MAKNGVAQCWLNQEKTVQDRGDGDGLEIWIGHGLLIAALACCSDAQQLFVVLLGGQMIGVDVTLFIVAVHA